MSTHAGEFARGRIASLLLACAISLAFAVPALALDDEIPEAARRLAREGLRLLAEERWDEALEKLRAAQVKAPSAPELHYDVGLALYRLQRYEEAAAAFEAAGRTGRRELREKALLQLGNVRVKQGKYEDALKLYDGVLELDPEDENARVNRAWVERKLAELAQKKSEQEKDEEAQKQVRERLEELVKRQIAAHMGLGSLLRSLGEEPPSSADDPLAAAFAALGKVTQDEPLPPEEAWGALASEQAEIETGVGALVDELRARLADAGAAEDPEAPALQGALPHLEAAREPLARASAAATDAAATPLHGAQLDALRHLLAALRALLDELSRLIQDEIQLLKDTFAAQSEHGGADESSGADPSVPSEGATGSAAVAPPAGTGAAGADPKAAAERGGELAGGQAAIRERTATLADQLRASLEGRQTQATAVGEDPNAQRRRVEEAISALGDATAAMSRAEASLPKPSWDEGIAAEKDALTALLRARQAMRPPQQGGDQGEQGEGEGEEGEEGDEERGGEGEEEGEAEPQPADEPKPGEGEPSDEESSGQDAGAGEAQEPLEKEGEAGELSPEQARKILERALQNERDRRRRIEEEAGRPATGGTRGKTW